MNIYQHGTHLKITVVTMAMHILKTAWHGFMPASMVLIQQPIEINLTPAISLIGHVTTLTPNTQH